MVLLSSKCSDVMKVENTRGQIPASKGGNLTTTVQKVLRGLPLGLGLKNAVRHL
jgi:hypothetical protein